MQPLLGRLEPRLEAALRAVGLDQHMPPGRTRHAGSDCRAGYLAEDGAVAGRVSPSYAYTNRRGKCTTYRAVCGQRATLLDNADRASRKPRCRLELNKRLNVKWPAIRAWGQYHSRILDRWAANTGRLEGATAEKAVPFPCAARRSVVLRLAELTCMTTSNEHRPRQLGSRLCGRSIRAFAPMRDWSRPSVIFERLLPWSRAACAVAH
jgi:hypothetical protein